MSEKKIYWINGKMYCTEYIENINKPKEDCNNKLTDICISCDKNKEKKDE